MKKPKLLKVAGTAVALTMLLSFTSFAGQWQQDATGWWYQNDDSSYPINQWVWIDSNGDGVSESYYFDLNGYCLQNTTTPDGYTVNESGAWTVNGMVQTQAVATQTQTGAIDPQVQAILPVEWDDYGMINYLPGDLVFGETDQVLYDITVSYWVENPELTVDYLKDNLGSPYDFRGITEAQRQGLIKGILTKYPHNA